MIAHNRIWVRASIVMQTLICLQALRRLNFGSKQLFKLKTVGSIQCSSLSQPIVFDHQQMTKDLKSASRKRCERKSDCKSNKTVEKCVSCRKFAETALSRSALLVSRLFWTNFIRQFRLHSILVYFEPISFDNLCFDLSLVNKFKLKQAAFISVSNKGTLNGWNLGQNKENPPNFVSGQLTRFGSLRKKSCRVS